MSATSTRVVTPTARTGMRLARPALILCLVVVAVLAAGTLLPDRDEDSRALSPSNTTPDGAQALVQVMRAHGIDVRAASSAVEAVRLGARADTTLVVVFPGRSAPDVTDAIGALPSVVEIGTEQASQTVAGGPTPGSRGAQPAPGTPVRPGAECSATPALRAGPVTLGAYGVSSATGWQVCYPLGDDLWAFAQSQDGERYRAVIPDSRLVRNAVVVEFGNAALAINAIARTDHVVWYLAQPEDSMSAPVTVAPDWMAPSVVLACAAGLVMALARGRRLGRLVPEDEPSHVPAAETVRGRGRLLRRSHDRAHAARSLRTDTALRTAARLGVPVGAPPEQLHAALVRAGIAPARAEALLWGRPPTSDQDLVDLADELARLEEDIRHD